MSNLSNNNNSEEKVKKKKAKIRIFQNKKKGINEQERIKALQSLYESIDFSKVNTFDDFPLSEKTKRGLKENNYLIPTDIQKQTIGLCLQGKDVLGAAKTGSGKTLAFLIPILEILYCKQWTNLDGTGALIITPTRELAYQIFEMLRKVGARHDFSAALIIGGKDLKFERKRLAQINIIIGTPGRILQHMDENPLFDCVNMQVLVLDEADRCLDMGFQDSMNNIIANLPPKRQTLLFSATQTKSVKDLIRLSLKDPAYISVHENAKQSTPENLCQSYTVCKLEEKMSVLWSFLRNHVKKKIIVFLSSCKQVKFIYEVFTKLRLGVTIMPLYGTLHQLRRMAIYDEFCQKTSAVLLATDLAARGLDFPKVDWVVQADCPEDPETYIHRVGRTARHNNVGASFLILLPSEEKMIEKLEQKKIPIEYTQVNPKKLQNPVKKMEAFLAKDKILKDSAQRAFIAYIKAIYLMRDKTVFDAKALNTTAFAYSLGLAIPPRIRFLDRLNKQKSIKTESLLKIDKSNTKIKFNSEDENDLDIKSIDQKDSGSKDENVSNKNRNNKIKFNFSDESDDNDEGIFTVKRRDHDIDDPLPEEVEENLNNKLLKKKPLTKVALAKKLLKKHIIPNTKVIFNESGEKVYSDREKQSALAQEYENADVGGIDIEKAKLVLREEDKYDRQRFREKVKAKHKAEKLKLKEQKKKEQEEFDDFGSDSDVEPDLSWLPDPDKVYGDNDNDEEDIKQDDTHNKKEIVITNKNKINKSQKRKLEHKLESVKSKKKNLENVSSSLSVNEAEELALMLLKNK